MHDVAVVNSEAALERHPQTMCILQHRQIRRPVYDHRRAQCLWDCQQPPLDMNAATNGVCVGFFALHKQECSVPWALPINKSTAKSLHTP